MGLPGTLDGVVQAPQRLLPAQHFHDLEDSRRGGGAGQGGAEGLCNLSQFNTFLVGISPQQFLEDVRLPLAGGVQARTHLGQMAARLAVEESGNQTISLLFFTTEE